MIRTIVFRAALFAQAALRGRMSAIGGVTSVTKVIGVSATPVLIKDVHVHMIFFP
jgi:hypothetical protein